jgi:hypothetical protein
MSIQNRGGSELIKGIPMYIIPAFRSFTGNRIPILDCVYDCIHFTGWNGSHVTESG